MKLTYLPDGRVIMQLNFNGNTYKQEFKSEKELKDFCKFLDKTYLMIGQQALKRINYIQNIKGVLVMQMLATRRVDSEIERYLLVKMSRVLAEKEYEKDTDYLQIFTIQNNELIVEQEQPKKKEIFKLSRNYNKTKLFAIKDEMENGVKVWTLLFPEEY